MPIIDVALAIGILTQLTKLGDLLFRENQKKAIQEKVELLTLKLEYAKPLNWFFSIFERKKLRVILIVVSLLPVSIIGFESFHDVEQNGVNISVIVLSSLILLITTWLGFKLYGLKILKWMIKDKKWPQFLSRYLAFVLGFVIAILPFQLYIVFSVASDQEPNIVFIGVYAAIMALTGAGMVWWVITVAGYVFISYRLVLYILKYFFKVMAWFLWRIVEYNKGVIAALSLIITVVLGIISIINKVP